MGGRLVLLPRLAVAWAYLASNQLNEQRQGSKAVKSMRVSQNDRKRHGHVQHLLNDFEHVIYLYKLLPFFT